MGQVLHGAGVTGGPGGDWQRTEVQTQGECEVGVGVPRCGEACHVWSTVPVAWLRTARAGREQRPEEEGG